MGATKDTTLLPAYLVDGEDHLKRDTVIRRLHQRLEREGDLSFNSDTFDGASADGEAIVSACCTVPFASEKRLVTVTDVDKLGKKGQTHIVDYLKKPAATTVLLLTSDKLAKNTALYKAVKALGSTAIIDCTPPKKRDLANQVRAMAPAHNITVTQKAAEALVELVGEDTVHLDAELNKLAVSHFTDGPVEEAEVRELVARIAEVKPWEFVNAFGARNMKECMRMKSLMPSASPYALLRQCVSRIREIMCAQTMLARGENAQQATAEALKMPDWKVRDYVSNARAWHPSELRYALESSMEAERKMKGGSVPEAAFTDWLVETLSTKRA